MNKTLAPENNVCLTLEDVVDILKIKSTNPRLQVMKLARQNILKGRKVGHEWRFHTQAVNDFLLGKS